MAGLLIAGVTACSHSTLTANNFEQAKQRWLLADLQDYHYSVSLRCYCTEDFTRSMLVVVRNEKVREAVYLDTGLQVPEKVAQSLRTIDQWFSYIDSGFHKPYFILVI